MPSVGNAELEEPGSTCGAPSAYTDAGPAAQDERVRVARAHLLGRDAVADELRVDAALAHAPRDQLRVLPAEVEHEHGPLLRCALREAARTLSADSSAPPS